MGLLRDGRVANGASDEAMLAGTPCIVFERIGGTEVECLHNTITTSGHNNSRDIKAGIGTPDGSWDYLQWSNDDTAAAASDLICVGAIDNATGGGIVQGTASEVTTHVGNYSLYHKWEINGTIGLAKICLHNGSATGGELMASVVLSTVRNMTALENVSMYYYIGES